MSRFNLALCQFFPDTGPAGKKLSLHAWKLLDKGLLWQIGRSWIQVIDFYPIVPAISLLQAIEHLTPGPRKTHLIFVWRQSSYVKGRVFQRTDRDAHLMTARCLARNIERLGKATVASLAVIGTQACKGDLVPSFVANHDIEVDELCDYFEPRDYPFSTETSAHDFILRANCTSEAIANQVIYAKMRGMRPRVVSVGQNALLHK